MRQRRLRQKWSVRVQLGKATWNELVIKRPPGRLFATSLRDARLRPPTRRIAPPPTVPDPAGWSDRGLYAAWLGHSTVLLKINGYFILTDPILGDRAGPDFRFWQVGIRRRVAPALSFDTIPEPDLILLSHAHMDHFDMPTLRRLANPRTAIVTARRTADLLRPHPYRRIRELGWGERARFGPIECKAFQVNHWGARYHSDVWRGYNGYAIEVDQYRVIFGGDTAMTDSFRGLRSSRRFDLAIMPIGAYYPRIYNHCNPEQAWQMAEDAGADRILPVHHQTFRLGQEPAGEPIERLYAAAQNQSHRIAVSDIGQHVEVG